MTKVFNPTALTDARARARISQIELGKKADISGHQVSRIESGRVMPRRTTIVQLADALEVDPDELYIETTEN